MNIKGINYTMFYFKVDILSKEVQWEINKIHWYIANIKSRLDLKYDKIKLYKQKGTGLTRYFIKSLPQFKGGYKYNAINKVKNN